MSRNKELKKRTKLLLSFLFVSLILVTNDANASSDAKHHLGLFVGSTSNFSAHHTSFSLGSDYEYRISNLLGVGLLGEMVFAEHKETLVFGSLFVHPIEGLKIVFGNGLAFVEDKSHYVFRLGTGYDFHVGSLSVTPTINFDFGDGNSFAVYGITFAIGL